eukprot:TRINITY_DN24157_c0_g1_i2.p1 TRINITY_DN24157_c0_g1~~TRINITY_DN24157_c0_g1_i2.p1  ORF type:complete len:182 (+),score=5.67 TRINITY_DN24157_c0_g1_i2:71-547(+)
MADASKIDFPAIVFVGHGAFCLVAGALGIVYPRVYLLAFSKEADVFAFMLTVRLYSCLIAGQVGVLYALTAFADRLVRRVACIAYAFIFASSSLAIFWTISSYDAPHKVTWLLWALGGAFGALAVVYICLGAWLLRESTAGKDSLTRPLMATGGQRSS